MKIGFLVIQTIFTSLTSNLNSSMQNNLSLPLLNLNSSNLYHNNNDTIIILDSSRFIKLRYKHEMKKNKKVYKRSNEEKTYDGRLLDLDDQLLIKIAVPLNKKISTDPVIKKLFEDDFTNYNFMCFRDKLILDWKALHAKNKRNSECFNLLKFYDFIANNTYEAILLINVLRAINKNETMYDEVVSKFVDSVDIKIVKDEYFKVSEFYNYVKHVKWVNLLAHYWNGGSRSNNGSKMVYNYLQIFNKQYLKTVFTVNRCENFARLFCNVADKNENSTFISKIEKFVYYTEAPTILNPATRNKSITDVLYNNKEKNKTDLTEKNVLQEKTNLIESKEDEKLNSKNVFNIEKIEETTTSLLDSEKSDFSIDNLSNDQNKESPKINNGIQYDTKNPKHDVSVDKDIKFTKKLDNLIKENYNTTILRDRKDIHSNNLNDKNEKAFSVKFYENVWYMISGFVVLFLAIFSMLFFIHKKRRRIVKSQPYENYQNAMNLSKLTIKNSSDNGTETYSYNNDFHSD